MNIVREHCSGIVVATPLGEFGKEFTVLNNRQEIRAQLEAARRELQAAEARVTLLEGQLPTDESSPPLLSQDSYAPTFDDLREGCQIFDVDWHYLYINDAAARHGRQPKDQLLGRTLLECYPGVEKSAMFALLQRCMTERMTAQMENEFIYPDGSQAWFELRIQPVPQGLFVLSLDITERHRAEEQLRRLHRTLTVLSDINQAIVRIRHIPTLLQHACQVAVEKGNFSIAWIALRNQETAMLEPVAHAVASAQDQEKLADILHDTTLVSGILTTMTRNRAPVVFKTGAARQAGYDAAVSFPLVVANTVHGALTLYTAASNFFDEAELRLLDEMASDLSFALEFAEREIQRQQAELTVRSYAKRVEILHEIDVGIIEAQSTVEVIKSAVNHIRQIIPCQRADVVLLDKEKNETVVYAVDLSGPSEITPGLRGPMLPAHWLAEFNAKRLKVVDDLHSLSAPLPIYTYAIKEGIRSFLHVLLMAEGQPLGLFNLAAASPGFFTPEHEEIAAQVGYQLAIAIHQMQLTEILAHHTAALEEHVAEIKRGQEALRRSEIYYRRILETAQEGVWITSSAGTTIYVNQAMADMLGYTVEEMLHTPLATFLVQENQIDLARRLADRQLGLSEQYDIRLRRKDGTLLWVLINSTPLVEESGEITSQVAMVADITERKRTEQALLASEQRFQRMADTSPALLWVTDATGARTFLSRAWYEYTGLTPTTALGHGWITSIHPAEREQVVRQFQAANAQQSTIQFDYRIRRADGEYRWALSNARPNFSETGVFIGHIGFVVDIHERKLAEQKLQSLYEAINQHAAELESRVIARTAQLQAAKDRMEAILDNSPDAMLLLRHDLSIQQANQAFAQLVACQPAAYLERPLSAFVHPEDIRLLTQMIGVNATEAQGKFVEIRAQRQDDLVFHAEMSMRTINGAELVCTVRDITERKKFEDALQQALTKERELNELKSRFVSMASHEFRTPLAAILTLTETLSSYRARMSDDQIDQRLLRIREQIGYLTEIMNDVLHLAQLQARRAEFNPTRLDLDALCRNVIDEFQSRPNTTHRFIYTCSLATQEAKLDRKLMRQIISNLLSNAVKYSTKESIIRIDLFYSAPHIVLKVSDQGIGIPAKDLPHLFDPFHRAENVGTISGTGLGLTITKESVELHGGTITVESQEKVGTTFTICLPGAVDEPA